MNQKFKTDVLIIGAGVVGLAIGIALLKKRSNLKVIIAEKEKGLAFHASGRNSGVLHSGFYYSPDSLKAKFCREGNIELRILAKKYGVPVRDVGKIVVTRNIEENSRLEALYERGIKNGVELEIREAEDMHIFEPLAKSKGKFLWSPTTGVSDPKAIASSMQKEYLGLGGEIHFGTQIQLRFSGGEIRDESNSYNAKHFINAAGSHADRLSKKVDVGNDYAMLPFMGIYRYTEEKNLPLRRLVYPVPHPVNPFLGVHFTLTIDNKVKIGPTAIPIMGREQYSMLDGWSLPDINQAIKGMRALIQNDSHDFGAILKTELPKIIKLNLVNEAAILVPLANSVKVWGKKPPGIRAQLVHLPTGKLEQDYVVRHASNSTHVLNAVSPGWTSAIPFGRWIAESIDV
jgi:L-2-hydroxyglutarate oxidase